MKNVEERMDAALRACRLLAAMDWCIGYELSDQGGLELDEAQFFARVAVGKERAKNWKPIEGQNP